VLFRMRFEALGISALGILHLAASLRYSERNRLWRIVNSHAAMFVPG
jgi:hypothetical protein